MSSLQINLIQGDVGRLAGLVHIEDTLRRIAWIALLSILVCGSIIGAGYIYTMRTLEASELQTERLSRDINAQSVKEGLLLSLVERTAIASRALESAKPWGKVFAVLTEVSSQDSYNSVSIDESALATSTLELGSVDEAVVVVTNIMSLTEDRLLRSPQILSFSMRENGTIQMTVSFHPVL